jgi:hypothetical protein
MVVLELEFLTAHAISQVPPVLASPPPAKANITTTEVDHPSLKLLLLPQSPTLNGLHNANLTAVHAMLENTPQLLLSIEEDITVSLDLSPLLSQLNTSNPEMPPKNQLVTPKRPPPAWLPTKTVQALVPPVKYAFALTDQELATVSHTNELDVPSVLLSTFLIINYSSFICLFLYTNYSLY